MKNQTEDAVGYNKEKQRIAEYREVENIDCITEEEMTDLFGPTYFDVNVYANVHYFGHYDLFMYISDYDQYLIDNGYDPFFAEFIDNLEESYVVPWIELYDSITLETNPPCVEIEVDYFTSGLIFELEKRLDQAKTWKPQSNNPAIAQKYENWISILNYIDGFITPQELDVLAECISTYASMCGPYERRKEILRNMCYQNSFFDIDLLGLESKICRIDVQVLYELTEILLELENCFFCTTNSDSKPHYSSGKHDWPTSTFYYCWEIFDLDRLQWYDLQTEITWANSGILQDIWEADHVVFIMDEFNATSTEYDYYMNQFVDNEQEQIDKIDIGDLECLTEDDLFKETWLVAGMEYPNFIDYFWEAEITELCFASNSWHTEYKDYCSEDDNYSKYKCYKEDSGFNYCDKDSCQVYSLFSRKRVLNEQYVLWKKYVQPIELEQI
jgi:hypothetical protein